MDLTKLNPCKLILTGLILIGLVLNVVVFLSIPLTGASFYIFQLNYATPFNGTLNDDYSFSDIRSIRFGNWGVCFLDDHSSDLHGIICTQFAFLYSVSVTNQATDVKVDLVSKEVTLPLIIHVIALIVSIVSIIPCGAQFTWSFIALIANLAAVIYDFVFFTIITNSVRSTPGLTTTVGLDPGLGIVSMILLALVLVHRTMYKGK